MVFCPLNSNLPAERKGQNRDLMAIISKTVRFDENLHWKLLGRGDSIIIGKVFLDF